MQASLIEFYGRECPHCRRMEPVIAQFEKETGQKVQKLEVWHDAKNEETFMHYAEEITKACGGGLGVPAFYNTATKAALCGESSLDELKKWAGVA